MEPGTVIVIVAVVAALAFGAYRAATDGRFRGTRAVGGANREPVGIGSTGGSAEFAADSPAGPSSAEPSVLAETPWEAQRGEGFTLVQFSSAFCTPCRAARRVLGDVAAAEPDVAHIEIDAEHHLDLVRQFGVTRTPTTIILDGAGREIARAQGAPTRAQVLAALGR